MSTKADFTEQEWDLVRMAPAAAGMTVIASDRGGTMRETFEMAKAYADTRKEHGHTELLDAVVAAKPERDHEHYGSVEAMRDGGLRRIRDAIALLEQKATAEEVEDYRGFIVKLSQRVAERHEEHGQKVSPQEEAAIREISEAVSGSAA